MAHSPADRRGLRATFGLYLKLLPYVRAEWQLVLLAMLAMSAATLIALGQPWPMQVVIDSVLGGRPTPRWITLPLGSLDRPSLLVVSIGLMLAAALLSEAIGLAQEYVTQLLGQRMVLRLRCDLYSKLQRLSLSFHDRVRTGDLIYRVTGGAGVLQDIVTYGLVPLTVQLITAIFIATTIFLLDVRLGFAAMVLVPFLFAWNGWFAPRLRRRSRGLADAERALYATAGEVLGSIRAVKSFAMEQVEAERFEMQSREIQQQYVRVVMLGRFGSIGTNLLTAAGTSIVIAVGALTVLQGHLTVGELLVFLAYLRSLYGPVTSLASYMLVIQRSAANVELVVQVLDEQDEHEQSGSARLDRVDGRLTCEHVSFSYEGTRYAARDVDFGVQAGEMVAFVGRSGAGKTTLASLLLRFYIPQQGRILLDGVDTATLDLRWLRQQIALVLQEPIIFSSSLAENIAYGRPGASREEIVEASRAAGLDDFIQELPDGYDTQVGERGVRLSGGQRQRLSIARAFLKDAPILILDEPTSNLDSTTERHIFDSIERLAHGRTTLVIAHRLATAQRADRIVVLHEGQIVEQGPPQELLAMDGAYARFYRDQTLDLPGTAIAVEA